MRRGSVPQSFEVAAALIGAVVGAGFASGQEVVSFFDPLGDRAFQGLAAAAAVLAGGSILVARAAAASGARDYGSLFRATAGPQAGTLLDLLVSAFLFLTLSVTLAGGAAILLSAYGLPAPAGLAVACGGAAILVGRGPARLFRVSGLLVPVLIGVLLLVLCLPVSSPGAFHPDGRSAGRRSLSAARAIPAPPASGGTTGLLDAVAAGLLYGCYNLVLGAGILVAGVRYRGRGPALAGAAAGGLVLACLALKILAACRAAGAEVLAAQVPVAALAAGAGNIGVHLYVAAVGLATLTTAGCIALSLAERCRLRWRGPAPVVLVLGAAPLASWGFARLVRTVYPVLGLVGISWLAILLVRGQRGGRNGSSGR